MFAGALRYFFLLLLLLLLLLQQNTARTPAHRRSRSVDAHAQGGPHSHGLRAACVVHDACTLARSIASEADLDGKATSILQALSPHVAYPDVRARGGCCC